MANGLTKMYEIVAGNPRLLIVLENFKIALGFGDQSIEEICKAYNINVYLFLTIINIHCCKNSTNIQLQHFNTTDARQILNYLKAAHRYFLDEKIPKLSTLIEQKNNQSHDKYSKIIEKFIHDYANEVFEHMNYENTVVFPYIESLLQKKEKNQDFNIHQFKKNHTNIEDKLTDLKNLLIKHIPQDYDSIIRRQILFELYDLERDINAHDFIENNLLIPIVENLEN